jgi:hypothetical protein
MSHVAPPRFNVGDRVIVGDSAPSGLQGRRGVVTRLSKTDDAYYVTFGDALEPSSAYLQGRWLNGLETASSSAI